MDVNRTLGALPALRARGRAKTLATLGALSLFALGVGGCDSGSEAAPPTGPGPVDPCILISTEDAAIALDLPIDFMQPPLPGTIARPENRRSGTRDCTVATHPIKPLGLERGDGFVKTTVRWYPGAAEAAAYLDKERTFTKDIKVVTDVGDSAFQVGQEIHFVRGPVFVSVSLSGAPDDDLSTRLTALATAAARRL